MHVLQFVQPVCTFLSRIFVFTGWSVLFVERLWELDLKLVLWGKEKKKEKKNRNKKWAPVVWDALRAFACQGFWWSSAICELGFSPLACYPCWAHGVNRIRHGIYFATTVSRGHTLDKGRRLHSQRKYRIFTKVISLSTALNLKPLAKHCPATDSIRLLITPTPPWNAAICNVAKPGHPDERLLVEVFSFFFSSGSTASLCLHPPLEWLRWSLLSPAPSFPSLISFD